PALQEIRKSTGYSNKNGKKNSDTCCGRYLEKRRIKEKTDRYQENKRHKDGNNGSEVVTFKKRFDKLGGIMPDIPGWPKFPGGIEIPINFYQAFMIPCFLSRAQMVDIIHRV